MCGLVPNVSHPRHRYIYSYEDALWNNFKRKTTFASLVQVDSSRKHHAQFARPLGLVLVI